VSGEAPKRTVDVVVLTMNDRDEEFRTAMASVLAQQDVDLRVVIVGNGVEPDYVPEGVQSVTLGVNTGIPEGRNVGADALAAHGAEFVLFFDNDAVLPDPHTVSGLIAEFDRRPQSAYVQPRIADPATGETLGRWVPRLRSGDARRSGVVTVMAEGIVLVRRADFKAVGGWPGHFFPFPRGSGSLVAAVGPGTGRLVRRGHRGAPPGDEPGPAQAVLPDGRT
jgi:GT2 family glycosyltransferase